MKKIVYSVLVTLSGLVLVLSYRTSMGETVPVWGVDAGASAQGTSSGTPATPPGGTSASGLADGTYLGDAVGTRYGDVQVQIDVSGGAITSVTVPQHPDSNGRDRQINDRAIPQLVSSTIAAQSADVHMVSGATYTSQGYVQSLQSALDQAQA